ncbi:MAG: hypothetical protein KDD67_02190 [Ignavibacteriae bacterium]|nr:hypothetical protein [Ignavibacteriota bacterium]MCB9215371.1 hypothetical protein [Ignavibacteria bacterium]
MPGASAPGYQRFAAMRLLFSNDFVTSRSDRRLVASCVSARNRTTPLLWSTSGASLLEIVIVNTLYECTRSSEVMVDIAMIRLMTNRK